MRVLLDTNVVLDLLLDRLPFSEATAKIWRASEERRIEAFVLRPPLLALDEREQPAPGACEPGSLRVPTSGPRPPRIENRLAPAEIHLDGTGRARPLQRTDYARSDLTPVVVQPSSAQADVPFLEMVIAEEERTGSRIPLDALIVLAQLRKERRLDAQTAAAAMHKNELAARAVLERLVEAGLVEGRGATRGRTHTLSAQVYQRLGQGADYIRQVGFDPFQREQMVLP